jgi:hypothetical protein
MSSEKKVLVERNAMCLGGTLGILEIRMRYLYQVLREEEFEVNLLTLRRGENLVQADYWFMRDEMTGTDLGRVCL